jgi:hypothetical protein
MIELTARPDFFKSKDEMTMNHEHDLKSWPEMFELTMSGVKNFELRKNDRNYSIGDRVRLREWEPRTQTYTGRECWREIRFVLDGVGPGCIEPLKGLMRGYCILGF